jgi:hypothetical protein
MASTSEVGHAKNVANFQDLIEFVIGYDTNYNPSKNSLKLPSLQALKTHADSKLAEVIAKNTAFNTAVNERVITFDGLQAFSTRLINALQATDASAETINDAKGFNRKIQGKRASKTVTPVDPNEPAPKTISASQLSYDQQIQHLEGLKAVLASELTYTPNEIDLQINSIEAKIVDLNTSNNKVATAYTNISNARIDRNKTLYTEENNLVKTAGEVKKYVKSVFGATSPEYAQISGIKFKKVPE